MSAEATTATTTDTAATIMRCFHFFWSISSAAPWRTAKYTMQAVPTSGATTSSMLEMSFSRAFVPVTAFEAASPPSAFAATEITADVTAAVSAAAVFLSFFI